MSVLPPNCDPSSMIACDEMVCGVVSLRIRGVSMTADLLNRACLQDGTTTENSEDDVCVGARANLDSAFDVISCKWDACSTNKGSFTYYVISRGGGGGFRNDYASVILIQ